MLERIRPEEIPVPRLDAARLRTGDVLLMRSAWQVSRWMAWNAECPYSHAALVLDEGRFIEARAPVVAIEPLRELDAPRRRIELVDVWRPFDRRDGAALDANAMQRIVALAGRWVGVPFAARRMPRLALGTLARHKLAVHPIGLHPPEPDEAGVTCTELVYRILDEAIGLELRERLRIRRPAPAFAWRELRDEWRLWREQRRHIPRQRARTPHVAPRRAAKDPRYVITTDLWSAPGLALVGCLRDRRRRGGFSVLSGGDPRSRLTVE
jgi:hypothetical protein